MVVLTTSVALKWIRCLKFYMDRRKSVFIKHTVSSRFISEKHHTQQQLVNYWMCNCLRVTVRRLHFPSFSTPVTKTQLPLLCGLSKILESTRNVKWKMSIWNFTLITIEKHNPIDASGFNFVLYKRHLRDKYCNIQGTSLYLINSFHKCFFFTILVLHLYLCIRQILYKVLTKTEKF